MMLKRFLRFMSPVGLMVALWVQQQPVGGLKLQTVALYREGFGSSTSRHYIVLLLLHYIYLIFYFHVTLEMKCCIFVLFGYLILKTVIQSEKC